MNNNALWLRTATAADTVVAHDDDMIMFHFVAAISAAMYYTFDCNADRHGNVEPQVRYQVPSVNAALTVTPSAWFSDFPLPHLLPNRP